MWTNMWDTDEYMDTSDDPWSWYYLADCGQWHRFEVKLKFKKYLIRDSFCLRYYFLKNESETAKTYSCSCFSSGPVFWEMTNPSCPYQLIPLNESTAEYLTVANYVKKDGLLDKPIVSICRIQNQDLWEFYCRKKKQLMRIHGVTDIQERRLFHGTKNSNVDSICKYNFDIRVAGYHGHVYGKGIYFAVHATFADKYSALYGTKTVDAQDVPTRIMFLARVLVGKSTMGQRDLNKPDQVAEDHSHDSCVDDIKCPKMYVIFDSNQIYPEYLIRYR
uniref:Poly [ADP-ribose] polymerase n=1 Tax=Neogobius melanostomus TaxID=47308 RepID=A0A8C6TQP8_9GOBI